LLTQEFLFHLRNAFNSPNTTSDYIVIASLIVVFILLCYGKKILSFFGRHKAHGEDGESNK